MRIDETMPNERYYEELKVVSRRFGSLRKAYAPLAFEVLRDALIFNDFYFLPAIDRSRRLTDGFCRSLRYNRFLVLRQSGQPDRSEARYGPTDSHSREECVSVSLLTPQAGKLKGLF